MKRVIEFAHELAKEKVNTNDICVDMTIGNGNDTLYLSKTVESGKVFGFDIQDKAIKNTIVYPLIASIDVTIIIQAKIKLRIIMYVLAINSSFFTTSIG